jgi:hypothetical protein
MKVNQIVGEHKKGFRAKKYAQKPKQYIEPIKPQGPVAPGDDKKKVNETQPGGMVGKISQVNQAAGTATITGPDGQAKTVELSQLKPGENNTLTLNTPDNIAPGTTVNAEKNMEEGPNDQLAQNYISQLTALMQQATQPWEKKQLEYRIKAVQSGQVPRDKKVLSPVEWEKTTDPTTIARLIGKDGLSPEYLQKSNMVGRGLDFIGLPGQHPTNPSLKFENQELLAIKKLSGL